MHDGERLGNQNCDFYYTHRYINNFVKILLNQTEIRMYLPFIYYQSENGKYNLISV